MKIFIPIVAGVLFLSGQAAHAWDPVKDLTGKRLDEHIKPPKLPKLPRLPNCGGDICDALEKGKKEVQETLEKGAKEAGNFLGDAETLIRTGKCGGDICDTLAKAADDTIDESERGRKNLEDAGQAIVKFVERQAHGVGDTLADADRRIREGKIIDAIWHLGIDPLRRTEQNAAKAAQESKLLASVGQIAASAYGPNGAAAYATWLTYRQTGDAELALRVGMITGATSAAMGAADDMPSRTTDELIRKTVVAGAIGGLAVAASGGDEAAIREGFLQTGATVLVRDGYRRITAHDLDARASEGEAYCMSTRNPELACAPKAAYKRHSDGSVVFEGGKPVVDDISKLDPRRPRVGNWNDETQTGMNHESGPVMTGLSKVPAMNAMALFHDQWSFDVNMDQVTNVATIIPAAVLTYIGTGAPAYDLIQRTNIESLEAQRNPNLGYQTALDALEPDRQRQVSFKTGTAAASILCIQGGMSRRIVVDAPSEEPGYACRVIYQNERGTSVPWHANNEVGYCRPMAVGFAVKQIAMGWTCYAQ